MNRRTVLGLAGTSAIAGLAGCIDGVREHFGLQGVIPIEIRSEAAEPQNIHLEARERGADRQSYEQSYSVTPEETVSAPHLDKTEQSFRVAKIEDESEATVRTVTVTPDVDLVKIRLYDDDLVVELEREDGENEVADGENRTAGNDPDSESDTGSNPDADDE